MQFLVLVGLNKVLRNSFMVNLSLFVCFWLYLHVFLIFFILDIFIVLINILLYVTCRYLGRR
jgi:hypothetical protein